MYKSAVILACVLVGLAGCGTAPPRPAARRSSLSDWDLSPSVEPAPRVAATNAPVSPTDRPPAPPLKPPLAQPALGAAGASRVSLDRWAAEHGFGKLRRTAAAPVGGFALPTSNGVLTLRPWSLLAGWDGFQFRLGFAPQLIDGQLFIHTLDLVKNLEPLLRGAAPPATMGKVIVIDPGHGGTNPGTRSGADGRNEKTFTLDWALRTARLLEANGWRVFLTRTNDADVSLAKRVAFAENAKADLFVSLHFNASVSGGHEQAGLETYCLTPVGMPSSLTREFVDNPAQSFPNNAFDEQNFLLALQLHRALLKATGDADRGVRRARFLTVLQGQNRPAVLVEGGYLSNLPEARRIGEAAFRQKLAEAVAVGLK